VRTDGGIAGLAAAIAADVAADPAWPPVLAEAAARHRVTPRRALAAVAQSNRLLVVGLGAEQAPRIVLAAGPHTAHALVHRPAAESVELVHVANGRRLPITGAAVLAGTGPG